jgi:cytochrome c biogenesis protein CcmG, thiol:disulfide interchange protein DsbE
VIRRRALLRVVVLSASLALLAGCNPSLTPPQFRTPDPSLVSQAALATCPTSGSAVKGGLPKVTLHCMGDGPSVDLAGLRGPAIVNAWYSACQPCKAEAPILAKFETEAGGKVLMLGVDSEAYPDPGLDFAYNENLHFAMLTDQHTDFVVPHFPSTYFLDAAGHLVGQPLSPIMSLQQLKDAVRTRLGVTVS